MSDHIHAKYKESAEETLRIVWETSFIILVII